MARSRAIGFVAGVCCTAATAISGCAADPGDAVKAEGGQAALLNGNDVQSVGEAGPSDDATASGSSGYSSSSGSTSGIASSSGLGSNSSSGSSSSGSASSSGAASSSGSDASPVVPIGPGCGDAGVTVITLMPGSGFTANTGNFMTTGPVCVELQGNVHQGWDVPNGQGRMVTVVSASGTSATVDATMVHPTLPNTFQAGSDGYVYWHFTAGSFDYTSLYIY